MWNTPNQRLLTVKPGSKTRDFNSQLLRSMSQITIFHPHHISVLPTSTALPFCYAPSIQEYRRGGLLIPEA